jgi:acetyl-CoA carboxylase biotin carboxyl carrier protein
MDRERIVNLVQVLKSSTALELAVREGDNYVRVRRFAAAAPPAAGSAPGATPATATSPATLATGTVAVTARLVGFFHPGQGPEGEPLVQVGDQVQQGQTVATIESLRQITAVPSPVSGTVLEIVAEPRQPVQFGDVLMLLQPAKE